MDNESKATRPQQPDPITIRVNQAIARGVGEAMMELFALREQLTIMQERQMAAGVGGGPAPEPEEGEENDAEGA